MRGEGETDGEALLCLDFCSFFFLRSVTYLYIFSLFLRLTPSQSNLSARYFSILSILRSSLPPPVFLLTEFVSIILPLDLTDFSFSLSIFPSWLSILTMSNSSSASASSFIVYPFRSTLSVARGTFSASAYSLIIKGNFADVITGVSISCIFGLIGDIDSSLLSSSPPPSSSSILFLRDSTLSLSRFMWLPWVLSSWIASRRTCFIYLFRAKT